MLPPAERIRVLEGSLRCFAFGWVSLLPLVGLPFVVLANRAYLRSRTEASSGWNPAQCYRRAGYGLSCLGGFVQFLALGCAVLVLLRMADL